MDIIDNHCHIISDDLASYPRAPLGGKQSTWAATRPVTAEQLIERMDANKIGQAVLVQATTAYGYDNSYVIDSARRWPERFVAVGTFDPLAPEAGARLREGLAGGLSGVRLFTAGSTLAGQGNWFIAPETKEFWEVAAEVGVTVCLQLKLGEAADELDTLLESHPGVTILLDHCGYPAIGDDPVAAAASLTELAGHDNLHLKLTHRNLEGLQALGSRATDFLDPLLAAFTGRRIAWGSNCPAADQPMDELVSLATDVLSHVDAEAQRDIFAVTTRTLFPSLGEGDTEWRTPPTT